MTEDRNLIISYNKANTLNLPYNVGKNVRFLKLLPGKNNVPASIWEAVNAHIGEDRMERYSRHIKVEDIVAEDGSINYEDMNAKDLIELVENTMETDELGEIEAFEEGRDTPRKTVLKSVADQVAKIEQAIAEIEAAKNE